MNIKSIQERLKQEKLDGWLLYDFRGSNAIALGQLNISADLLTRRFFYWIPATGQPKKIVHAIEKGPFKHLPGEELPYHTWKLLHSHLKSLFRGSERIAMEYSPNAALPTLSLVDAGTVELIRSFGVDVMSSANLLQTPLTKEQVKSQREAALHLDQIVELAWAFIKERLGRVNEFDVIQMIQKEMETRSLITDSGPICAVGPHSADPHYIPTKESATPIQSGDFVLIDLWGKMDRPGSIFGDICRVAVCGRKPTEKEHKVFSIVREAQRVATELVKTKKTVFGFEVDQTARDLIEKAGYGEYFIHRTGHNIGEKDHGDGTNIDNFETKDNRLLLPGSCFSIEPGIYLPGEFGVRLEYDILYSEKREVEITGGIQDEILVI